MSSTISHRLKTAAQLTRGLFLTDHNRSAWGRVWQLLSRLTWELPQTLVGWLYSVVRALAGQVDRRYYLRNEEGLALWHGRVAGYFRRPMGRAMDARRRGEVYPWQSDMSARIRTHYRQPTLWVVVSPCHRIAQSPERHGQGQS